MLKEINVENLIVFCPAAYTIGAWDVEFGKGFTEIIRNKKSFTNTNITELLSFYNGRILLILPQEDKIIPDDVVEIYKNEVMKREGSKILTILNCPHPIHRWIVNKDKEKQSLLKEIDSFLR